MLLGYSLALLIGLSLGLLGGGGSIVTVPILVYAIGMEEKLAIALSLAIVGATSLIGAFSHYKKGNVDFKVFLAFGPVAMLGTFLGAKLSVFFSGQVQLLMFAVIMILAAYFMLKGRQSVEADPSKQQFTTKRIALIAVEGIVVGIITGLVGVGGGFLIVPALVLLAGISMKRAVGTSLLIISVKSFAGFSGYLGIVEIPWDFLARFTAVSGLGILAGSALVKHVPQKWLKKIFALFLIMMGIFIFYQNYFT